METSASDIPGEALILFKSYYVVWKQRNTNKNK